MTRRAFLKFLALGAAFTALVGRARTLLAAPAAGRALVVVYSRSGNTAAMAAEIAGRLGAATLAIRAPAYGDDFFGWTRASYDAWNKLTSEIEVPDHDLAPYDWIFLGSPIWWYRPSPPLWSYLKASDLGGKKVVLFNTFNSRFKDEEIAEFRRLVEQKGGQLVDHVYVRRGRVYDQLSRDEMLAEIRARLDERADTPPFAGN